MVLKIFFTPVINFGKDFEPVHSKSHFIHKNEAGEYFSTVEEALQALLAAVERIEEICPPELEPCGCEILVYWKQSKDENTDWGPSMRNQAWSLPTEKWKLLQQRNPTGAT